MFNDTLSIDNDLKKEMLPDFKKLFDNYAISYTPANLALTTIQQDIESKEYSAYTFAINNKIILFRTAKITPKKAGLFVTCWKRIEYGPIMPYDITDQLDFFIINIKKKTEKGHFIFPKTILLEKDILSVNGSGGKRGFRVYPPWHVLTSKQALQTQTWQCHYFVKQ